MLFSLVYPLGEKYKVAYLMHLQAQDPHNPLDLCAVKGDRRVSTVDRKQLLKQLLQLTFFTRPTYQFYRDYQACPAKF